MLHCHIFRQPFTLFLTLILTISPTAQQQLTTTDLNALHQLMYSLTDVKTGGFFSTWDFSSPENACSSFAGVTCAVVNNNLRVVSLYLGTGLSDSPGLAGTISDTGLYELTELTQLVLFPGIVTGFIPSEIGHRLKNLRVISLTNNRLTGAIPESISELQNLHTLDLSHNKLTGKIPTTLTSALPELRVLVLSDNELTGEIPEFSDDSELMHLDLRNNMLTGTLPEKIPATLRYLSLSSNGLWGPVNWMTSAYLVYLDLSMNKFSGPIKDTLLRSCTSSMYLQRNNFSGELPLQLPLSFSGYGAGSTVDLSHNYLTGNIPNYLNSVETLFLNNNHFIGKVPESYVSNVFDGMMRTLYLQHNYLTAFPMGDGEGTALPDGVALCLSYNCMVPPAVGLTACPVSAGGPVTRPLRQCDLFKSGDTIG
ncbi:putative leucine-rich repeat-containing, plant-type, leucine-rich repeat domain superfamily [Helianthus anomalus]